MREADKQSSIPAAPKAREGRPFFQFYPADWIASTRGLSGAARGYHIDMLALAWLHGGCDSDTEALRRSVGAERAEWRKVWPELAPRWREVDGRLVNDRQERVRQEAEAYATSKSLAGKKGGQRSVEARAEAFGSADPRSNREATREATREAVVKPSPSPSPSYTTTTADAPVVVARAPDAKWGHSPTTRRRLGSAYESAIGLDVQEFLDREFAAKLVNAGVSNAGDVLQTWYRNTEQAWTGREVGEDAPKFWRKRFEEWRGSTPKAAPVSLSVDLSWADDIFGVAKGGAS